VVGKIKILKFTAIFVDFSEARDLFVIIFKILDLIEKSRTAG
jgi:hypothetical protein